MPDLQLTQRQLGEAIEILGHPPRHLSPGRGVALVAQHHGPRLERDEPRHRVAR
jgi:hypothetical protein